MSPTPEISRSRESRRGLFRKAAKVAIAVAGGGLGASILLNKESSATDELPPNPQVFTDSLGRSRKWETINLTNSIPPNEEVQGGIPTIFDSINNAEPILFQPKRSLYPTNTYSIGSRGQLVDSATNKFYMANSIRLNEDTNTSYPRIEIGSNVNNPTDYAARILLPTDGLPQGGTFGSMYSAFKLNVDNNGKYLEVGIKNSRNKSEDGTYRIRLDKDGLASGVWIKAEQMKQRFYLPVTATDFKGS